MWQTLDAALFAGRPSVAPWMPGLIQGSKAVPEKFQPLSSPLAQGRLGEDTPTRLFMVNPLVGVDLIKAGFLNSDSEPAEPKREAREDFLAMLHTLTPEDRAGTLHRGWNGLSKPARWALCCQVGSLLFPPIGRPLSSRPRCGARGTGSGPTSRTHAAAAGNTGRATVCPAQTRCQTEPQPEPNPETLGQCF